MRELPYSISVFFYTESFNMLETVKLAHRIAQIAGFSLEVVHANGSWKDEVEYKEYSLVSHHTEVQREFEADVCALEQVSPDIVRFQLMVGRMNTAVGTKHIIALNLPKDLPTMILDQLEDFMMVLIIAVDRFIKLGINVLCSIGEKRGDWVGERPFVLYRSRLIDMFEQKE